MVCNGYENKQGEMCKFERGQACTCSVATFLSALESRAKRPDVKYHMNTKVHKVYGPSRGKLRVCFGVGQVADKVITVARLVMLSFPKRRGRQYGSLPEGALTVRGPFVYLRCSSYSSGVIFSGVMAQCIVCCTCGSTCRKGGLDG